MFSRKGQRVLLRLHKGYNIPAAAILGKKLGQQYVGPFQIVERVGRRPPLLEDNNGDRRRYLVEYIGLGNELTK
ncbi:hypothetical protein F5Y06DRAFT_266714 [Hypoxylon sp. FL0890]|nr:hypothetical protein F5Y06DRAFT_266714 [Hypoxylon sp. FL0890]